MKVNKLISNTDNIQNKIYTIRNVQVMLDEDLAELYKVTPKRLNEQVKRNLEVAICDHIQVFYKSI